MTRVGPHTVAHWVRRRTWLGWPSELVAQAAVWAAAAGLAAVLFVGRGSAVDFPGIARGRIVQLSVPWDARVRAMPVEPFQAVRRGDVVAMLDDSVLQGQIGAIEAEIERLRAEHGEEQELLDADVRTRQSRWESDARAFENDAAQLAVALQEARADLEYDRALLQGLRANLEHLDRLIERGHAAPSESELTRAEAAATAGRVEEGARLVSDLDARLRAAEERRVDFRAHPLGRPARGPAADHLTQAIAVQESLLRELVAQRDQCVVRAPFDGTVLEIHGRAGDALLRRPGEGNLRRPGESMGPGEPIVVLAAERPTEVIAWAVEGHGDEIRPGVEVLLSTTGTKRQLAPGTVSAVGASVEHMPERLWSQLQVPEWGRPFVIPLPPSLAAAAGDRVEVRLR